MQSLNQTQMPRILPEMPVESKINKKSDARMVSKIEAVKNDLNEVFKFDENLTLCAYCGDGMKSVLEKF